MPEILSLADARLALRKPADDLIDDPDLTNTYIPATTALVESIVGPILERTDLTATFDGGDKSLLLPHPFVQVTELTVDGVSQTATTDYTVNPPAGVVTSTNYYGFVGGSQNVVVTYDVGIITDTADVPVQIKLAARIILAHLWQIDQQGFRPAFNGPDQGTMTVGVGYAIPNRAAELLAPFVTSWGVA